MPIASNPLAGAVKRTSTSGLALTAFDKILKEYYLPATRDILNSKRILSRFVRQTTQDVEGKYAVISLNNQRNEGLGYAGEGGKLPLPKKQGYEQAIYEVRYSYGRMMFTGPAIMASRSDRGAFLRVLDGEVKGLARDIQHEDNRIMFGDGSGRLCQLNAASTASTDITVDNPGGFTNPGRGTQYIRPGMRLCVVQAASEAGTAIGDTPTFMNLDGAGAQTFNVVSVDHTTGTITADITFAAATATDGADDNDYIYKANDTANNTGLSISRGMEPFGLAALIDDGNPGLYSAGVGNIDATANQWWQSAVLDNGGTSIPFSPDMCQSLMDILDIQGDGTVHMWLTSHGIRRQYVNLETAQKRYPGTMEFDGGFKAIEFDGRPFVVDKDITRGRIYGLDREVLNCHQQNDYDFMDKDGSYLHRLEDYDGYHATLFKYWQLTTWARNRLGVIKDIQDS